MDLTDSPPRKTFFIKDIRENQKVSSTFLVKRKSIASTKAGKPFLTLILGDKTGEIPGRVWEQAEQVAGCFQKDDFIKVQSTAITYQGVLQLSISSLRCCQLSEIDTTDFLPQAERDREETFGELLTIAEKVENPYLRKLLNLFFADEEFIRLFKSAPAAKKLHHVYLGGLLEHTVSVAKLIIQAASHYGGLNLNLLLTAGILHDIGKVHELVYSRSFDYSDAGRLLGHIVIGVEMIGKKLDTIPDFPADLALDLKHLVTSHHGQHDYGSPKRPKTIEAIILFYLDDLDAKVEEIQSFLRGEAVKDSRCTGYHQMLGRYIYRTANSRELSDHDPRNSEETTIVRFPEEMKDNR